MRNKRNSKMEAIRRMRSQSALLRCNSSTLSYKFGRLLTGCHSPTRIVSNLHISATLSTTALHILYQKVRDSQNLKEQRIHLAQLIKDLPYLTRYKNMEFQSFICHKDGTNVYFPTYEPRKGLEDVARSPLSVDSLSASTACVLHERGTYCLLHWGYCPPAPVSRYNNINKHFVNDIFVRCFERMFRGRAMSTFRNTVVIDCGEAGTTRAMSRLFDTLRVSSRKPYSHTIIN